MEGAASGSQFLGQNAAGTGSWGLPSGMTLSQAAKAQQKKFYTIQRVNGNGGNGKGDGVAGPHKHSLEESDRVKKNSVQRWLTKNEKDKKKVQVCFLFIFISKVSLFLLHHVGFPTSNIATLFRLDHATVPVIRPCYSSNKLLHDIRDQSGAYVMLMPTMFRPITRTRGSIE